MDNERTAQVIDIGQSFAGGPKWECTNCGETLDVNYLWSDPEDTKKLAKGPNYCPNCGAKLIYPPIAETCT